MAFEYSTFISYRHEKQRNEFVKNFCTHFNTTTFDVTNLQQHFLDSNEIKGSPNFGDRIYDAIRNSYFFTIFHTFHYLNEDNPWCAKELKYALDVESCRKEKLNEEDKKKFSCLNLFIVSGTDKDLPIEISGRNALEIFNFQHVGRKPTKALQDFFQKLYDFMIEIYKIYRKYPKIDFTSVCNNIPVPTDKEIFEWIKRQKEILIENEAEHEPTLKKDGE